MNPAYAALIVLALFIWFILLKKEKTLADYTLIVMNLLCGLMLYSSAALLSELTRFDFYVNAVTPPLFFSFFLVYAAQLLTGRAWRGKYACFFAFSLPMTLFFTYDLWWSSAGGASFVANRFKDPPLIYHLFYKGHFVFAIALSVYVLRRLRDHVGRIKQAYSSLEEKRLRWLRNFALVLLVVQSVSLAAFLAYNLRLIVEVLPIYEAMNLLMIPAFFYFSFRGIRHYSLETAFVAAELEKAAAKRMSSPPSSAVAGRTDDEPSRALYDSAVALFETTSVFTIPQLKLSDVAERLDVPAYLLSQAVNAYYGKPFYDFVARYRVKLLRELLLRPAYAHYSILGLGLECGFNSKATMNRVFKEHTGLTPTQYRKAHRADASQN